MSARPMLEARSHGKPGEDAASDLSAVWWSVARIRSWVCAYWPACLAMLIMLPRLAAAEFGLLDDAVTLAACRIILHDQLSYAFTMGAQAGRFSPVIMLFYSAVYLLGGASAFFFFCVNALLLIAVTILLIRFVRSVTGSRIQASLTAVVFLLSAPVIENYYTVTKGEPLQALFFVGSAMLLLLYRRVTTTVFRIAILALVATALWLAICSKETGIIILPISVGWLLAGLYSRRGAWDPGLKCRFAYMLASLLACTAFFVARASFIPGGLTDGTYVQAYSLGWRSLLISVAVWFSRLLRDFPYLFPAFAFVLVALTQRRLRHPALTTDAGIWMAGWVAVFLPWPGGGVGYYLLPFALGSAVFFGSTLVQMLGILSSSTESKTLRFTAGICMKLSLVLLCMTLPGNVTNLRMQLAIDDANADVVEFVAGLPINSRVLLNIPKHLEYFFEFRLHLGSEKRRADVTVEACEDSTALLRDRTFRGYIVAPEFQNQIFPSIRVGVDESSVQAWNRTLLRDAGSNLELLYSTLRQVQLMDFGFHRPLCLLSGGSAGLYCNYPRAFVEARVSTYGWRVYRVQNAAIRRDISASAPPSEISLDQTVNMPVPVGGQ